MSGMNDVLQTISSILLKAFWLGVGVTLLSMAIYYGFKPFYIHLIVEQWAMTDETTLNTLVLNAYTAIKLYLFYVLLIPALAIRWQLRSVNK